MGRRWCDIGKQENLVYREAITAVLCLDSDFQLPIYLGTWGSKTMMLSPDLASRVFVVSPSIKIHVASSSARQRASAWFDSVRIYTFPVCILGL